MANRYWVGGTNAWDSTTTAYWSATSGGSGGASVPTSADDVYFDAGTTMTVTGTVVCRSLTVDAAASIGYSGGSTLQIYGSLYFGPNGYGWFGDVQFLSTSTGNTLYMAPSSGFGSGSIVTFNGAGGSWTQTTDGDYYAFELLQGTYSTGGYGLSVVDFNSSNTNTRTLALSNSSIEVSSTWNASTATNLTVTYSVGGYINVSGQFWGGGKSWPTLSNLNYSGGGNYLTVYGSSTFYSLNMGSSLANPGFLTFESGTTTTVLNDISFAGSASPLNVLHVETTSSGAATISMASGTVYVVYTSIQNSTATGGATFRALTSQGNIDAGGNTGWIFASGSGNFFAFF